MRRLAFLTALVLYAWSAMDMHEWARVPRVVFHLLEHHGHHGHHDHEGSDHEHEDGSDDHNPFHGHTGEVCGAMTIVSIAADHQYVLISVPSLDRALAPYEDHGVLVAHTGSKWNPPKEA